MKKSLLIDSGLFNNFWAKAIEIANYLENRLFTKIESHEKLILEGN